MLSSSDDQGFIVTYFFEVVRDSSLTFIHHSKYNQNEGVKKEEVEWERWGGER